MNDRELVIIQSAGLVSLATSKLCEGLHGLLDNLNDVSLEALEVVLNSNQVISVVVLGNDLAVQTVQDTAVDDIRVVVAVEMTPRRVERSRMLSKQLYLLLSGVASLVNFLCALLGAMGELLGLVLDLLMQAFENGEDRALDALFGFDVGVDEGLRVGAHVLEESGNAAQTLVEVVALLEGVVDGLLCIKLVIKVY